MQGQAFAFATRIAPMNLYEVHIPVSDLQQSIAFYRDVLGFELAFEVPHRHVAFMWIGRPDQSMLGLWGPNSDYGWKDGLHFRSHFAVAVTLAELHEKIRELKAKGIETLSFGGKPADEPSVIGWMPTAQIYFSDPDNHSLEYIAMLPEAPDADFIGTLSEWRNRNRPKTIIGLTGNIATGKSTIMKMAAARGATIIDADKVGHGILHNAAVKVAVRDAFGDSIFDEHGNVLRPALGKIVFSDSAKLKQLEAITHPAIREAISDQIANAQSSVVVVEAIKLLEGPLKDHAHQIWVTACDPDTQVARLVEFRDMSAADARQRVNAQSAQSAKIAQADVVFDTNGSLAETEAQFEKAWETVSGGR